MNPPQAPRLPRAAGQFYQAFAPGPPRSRRESPQRPVLRPLPVGRGSQEADRVGEVLKAARSKETADGWPSAGLSAPESPVSTPGRYSFRASTSAGGSLRDAVPEHGQPHLRDHLGPCVRRHPRRCRQALQRQRCVPHRSHRRRRGAGGSRPRSTGATTRGPSITSRGARSSTARGSPPFRRSPPRLQRPHGSAWARSPPHPTSATPFRSRAS